MDKNIPSILSTSKYNYHYKCVQNTHTGNKITLKTALEKFHSSIYSTSLTAFWKIIRSITRVVSTKRKKTVMYSIVIFGTYGRHYQTLVTRCHCNKMCTTELHSTLAYHSPAQLLLWLDTVCCHSTLPSLDRQCWILWTHSYYHF